MPGMERRYRNTMRNSTTIMKLLPLLVALLVAACSTTDEGAYIFHDGEFNRASDDFAKTPQDIDSVTICYNKYGTKPGKIATMAKHERGRVNKKSVFIRQSSNTCPLFTPVAAIFNCQGL